MALDAEQTGSAPAPALPTNPDMPLRSDHTDRLITTNHCPAAGLLIEPTIDLALNRHSTAIFLPTMTTGAKGFRDHD